ncbi:ABC transporter permease [Candidatus Methylospira mobilis]|uniref:ABC transporter permease n=1 Tax=Candidatus Methylospira mobilis TaxID=1808979 RepID=A0A5Q0BNM1_9GAMM|nr:ABC transporter permease [Candidatus Methylospira mobilis]QFY45209.1 ABC transporter permease [Candidatus Methylospira mobilis]
MQSFISRFSWSWVSIPLLLLIWCLCAGRVPAYVFPQPWDVAQEALRWASNGSLLQQFKASLLREVGGFSAAALAALMLGTATGLCKGFRDLVSPLNGLFMAIPPIAWAPLTMIVFGLGYLSIVLVIFIAAMFPMTVTIQDGIQAIRNTEIRAARSLGANRLQLLRHVYLPASLPAITTALRVGFSQAWRALVAAEMIGASQGIGWMVSMGGQVGNSSQVMLGIVLIGLSAWLAESMVFRRLEQHYQHWRVQ